MSRLLIPAAVVDHWEPKFEDLKRHGITTASDRTYAKVMDAPGKRAIIDADKDDLEEIEAECANWLDGETDVSVGNDPADRRFRYGYLKLREATKAALAQFHLSDHKDMRR